MAMAAPAASARELKGVTTDVVILVGAVAVLLVFLMMGCRLTCGKKRKRREVQEGYWRTEIANDTSGSGGFYQTPLNYSLSYPTITWQDSPHYQANPENKYQPLEAGPVDTEAALRRLTTNWDLDPNSNQPPIWGEFDQYYTGRRGTDAAGNVVAGQPFIANALKPRYTLTTLGDTFSKQLLQNEGNMDPWYDRAARGPTLKDRLTMRKTNVLQFPENARQEHLAKYVRASLDTKL